MASFLRPNKRMMEARRQVSDLARAASEAGMVYCSDKKCGWGWDVSTSPVCPQCGAQPEGKSLKEAEKQLKKTVGRENLDRLMRASR